MVIYRDVPVKVTQKGAHVRRSGGRVYSGFYTGYGDVPVVRFNDVTNRFEPVVNPRGYAYALRADLRFRGVK